MSTSGTRPLLLDHVELLFAPFLRVNVLRLLRDLSRLGRLVVAWPGEYHGYRLTYARPGHYTEVLKVTDDAGRFDYDFAVVQVFDKRKPLPVPPAIHAAYWPTTGIKVGDEITFKVRSFGIKPDEGRETWDFGDGREPVHTRSDGNARVHARDGYATTTHRYTKPGHYIVTVSRTNDRGETATGRLHLVIAAKRATRRGTEQ